MRYGNLMITLKERHRREDPMFLGPMEFNFVISNASGICIPMELLSCDHCAEEKVILDGYNVTMEIFDENYKRVDILTNQNRRIKVRKSTIFIEFPPKKFKLGSSFSENVYSYNLVLSIGNEKQTISYGKIKIIP